MQRFVNLFFADMAKNLAGVSVEHCNQAFPFGEGGAERRRMRACRQQAQHGAMFCFHQSLIRRSRLGCFSVSHCEIVGVQPTKKNSARRIASRTALPTGEAKGTPRRAALSSPPLCKGRCRRTAAEGLLQSHETTPQAPPGCFSVSLAKSSVFSRRRKTPRDASRLVQLTPCTGEPNHAPTL